MNYNANSAPRSAIRKPKRVSDVNSLGGLPAQQPQQQVPFNPYNPQMGAFPPNGVDFSQQQQPSYGFNMNAPPPQPGFTPPSYGMDPMQQGPPPPGYGPGPGQRGINVPMPGGPQMGMFAQPIVQDMAMQYGQRLADTGKSMVKQELDKYVSVSRLKYYFAVDTRYVVAKLGLLFFPFTHSDWSIKYEQDNPVQPRYEINAPDLYIPTMAYVTYVLVAGLSLGMQQRFTPEQISIQASSALAWCLVELGIYLATLYVMNIQTTLRTLDLLAYSGYKYVGIIASILISLLLQKTGYYIVLIYCNLALAFFLIRSLKILVLPESQSRTQQNETQYYGGDSTVGGYATSTGSKRRRYFLLFVAVIQPIISWWLSFRLISSGAVATATDGA